MSAPFRQYRRDPAKQDGATPIDQLVPAILKRALMDAYAAGEMSAEEVREAIQTNNLRHD